ncbi:phospholipase D-like domain-containing protein [Noviherbaspirillum galbum]|uniref:Cardiolipin synthase B n=1 Tax=Noviherbaspirillum galbum TaxID=2709383 RepID=A0A6B3SSN0_9BURK|nr:phospholipase D-like domain-containing protein [Noviherbaspirillum galbum]NEX63767.1 cardiolipin synthase B [Noviherbaspirillum galbum]
MRSLRHTLFIMALAFLGGCASLPDVAYLRDRHLAPRQEPTIVAAGGALSTTRSQAIIDRLGNKADAAEFLSRHVAAEQAIAGKPLVAGNKVILLDDGPITMRAMMSAIRAAKDHVNLETYIFEADEVGRALADLLIQKRASGVQVNLIYDSVGTLDTPKEFFERLRAAGINTLEFNPVNPLRATGDWDINQRDHRKLLVVDGKVAFTGGVNISKVYGKSSILGSRHAEPPPKDPKEAAWRDTHMQIEGPVVAEFQKLFLDTWQRKTGNALVGAQYFPPLKQEGNALVRALGSTADDMDFTIYKTYISAFANANKSIHLTTAYFVPDRQVVQAMIDAARRGVDVEIIFPSLTDVDLILYAGRSFYEELLQGGVRIYERKAAVLHAKTAVIDGVWSTIGSTNLDIRSFLHNDEINAVVLGADFADKMEALFQRDIRDSNEVSLEQWRRRGMGERMREWAVRFLDYWL